MIGRSSSSSSTCCCFILFLALNIFVRETSGKQKFDSSRELINSNGEGEGCSCLNSNGVGEGCSCLAPAPEPTSPPSEEPDPSDFQDIKLFLLYPVIQLFKSTITSDPRNITSTWVGPDICNKYMGFYCDNPPYNQSAITVASIDFNGFQLAAPSVMDFVEKFIDLALFHANSNFFGGTITSGISNLSFLYELDLSNNLFSGPFPVSVFSISQISFLDIRYNSFSGSVPKQLFFLNLEILFINNNNFVQRLPENLGSSPVSFLTLANNKFSGTIPRSIGNASLIEVLFLNNDLCGCLPYEIGFLKEATVFDAGSNRLTGPIPYSFACLKKVEQLNLAGNLLYGPVPEVVCAALGNLQNLSLSDNYFTYIGPICRKLMRRAGVEFDDRKNCIAGRPNQRPVEECLEFLMKKAHCPFPGSYYLIPCMWSHSEFESAPPKTTRYASPRSYAALHRH